MGRKNKPGKKEREFDMSKYKRKHVALRFSYVGSNYQGLAVQDHTDETVEAKLFEALRKVRLINDAKTEKIPEKYSRCGRTDKGVSALGQVAAMSLRSAHPPDSLDDPVEGEMDYAGILNRVLPENIRVSGWAYVEDNFNARFSCSGRVYKYFFFKGAKNVERMREAASFLVGEHDFRNFAKLDVVNVSNFVRTLYAVTITPALEELSPSVWVITVVGSAFLYHQVRCMVSILFDIGEGHEEPSLIKHLLDIEETPARPCYNMAPPDGLVLWDCLFPDVRWNATADSYEKLLSHFAMQYQVALIPPLIFGHMHQHFKGVEPVRFLEKGESHAGAPVTWEEYKSDGPPRNDGPSRVEILKRPVEKSYEQKVEDLHGSKKARLDANRSKCTGAAYLEKAGDSPPEHGKYKERAVLTPADLARYTGEAGPPPE